MSVISCCLPVSLILIGDAPSFLGQLSHNIIIVALSLGFLNMLKLCYLMMFSLKKMQKTKTQDQVKSLLSYLHNGSTLEHNLNWFGTLQWRATTFVFLFLEISHVTNLLTTHGKDPDTQNHHDIVFLNFFVIHFFLNFWLQC